MPPIEVKNDDAALDEKAENIRIRTLPFAGQERRITLSSTASGFGPVLSGDSRSSLTKKFGNLRRDNCRLLLIRMYMIWSLGSLKKRYAASA